jgi:hypothetical protein
MISFAKSKQVEDSFLPIEKGRGKEVEQERITNIPIGTEDLDRGSSEPASCFGVAGPITCQEEGESHQRPSS